MTPSPVPEKNASSMFVSLIAQQELKSIGIHQLAEIYSVLIKVFGEEKFSDCVRQAYAERSQRTDVAS